MKVIMNRVARLNRTVLTATEGLFLGPLQPVGTNG